MRGIIIYGPPGAGKGTQANLLADALGYIHFDTGKYLESVVNDPKNKDNLKIQEQKKIFDAGELLSPPWVFQVVRDETIKICVANIGLVFSGSPRTMDEAWGDGNHEGLVKEIEQCYGKKNIIVIYLKVKAETSIHRNSRRFVCEICGRPVLYFQDDPVPKHCGFCGGSLRKRSLDSPDIIKERLAVFEKRTLPIVAEFKKRGYNVWELNGEERPNIIFQKILEKLKSL